MWDTPAAVDRQAGVLYINPKLWFALTRFQRKFIKYHEYGHYYLNTDSEIAADAYAFDKLAGTEFRSLKQCIECLETILDESLPGHKVRIDALYQRALAWDAAHPEYKKLDKGSERTTQAELLEAYNQGLIGVADSVNNQATINANRETGQKQAQVLMYCVLGIAALMILKD